MNPAQQLHTAARHYCQSQSDHRYQQAIQWKQHPDPDLDRATARQRLLSLYGRAEILNLIGVAVERLNFDHLNDFEWTRDRILQAGQQATTTKPRLNMGQTYSITFAETPKTDETQAAIADEKAIFCTYLQSLSSEQLQAVEPSPYQRVLPPEESESLWSQFRQQWQIKGHRWHPLVRCKLSNIVAFYAEDFEEYYGSPRLQEQLISRQITRIWELRELGIEYEQDVSLFDPVYNGYEGYWSSASLDWIVYASHEDSITLGGWLLDDIKAKWPEWAQHLWS